MNSLKSSPLAIVFILVAVFTQLGNAQLYSWKSKDVKGNGKVETQTRNVSDFDAISVSQAINVIYKVGDKAVEVTAESNLFDKIETYVEGDQLIIRYKKGLNVRKKKPVYVAVTSPSLKAVYASSSSSFTTEDTVESSKFSIKASSSADVNMAQINAKFVDIQSNSSADVEAQSIVADKLKINGSSSTDITSKVDVKEVNASISSAADLTLSGTATKGSFSASSGAEINAFNLKTKTSHANASSGADVDVHVETTLFAKASSGGDVSYKGSPAKIEKSTSSGGQVSKGY